MAAHPEFQLLSRTLALWHRFDRAVKADLFSTALSTTECTYLIDPIPLDPIDLAQLQTRSPIGGIIVTNQNHWRASPQLSTQLSVPIFAHPAAETNGAPQQFSRIGDGDRIGEVFEVIDIEGAAPGEIGLFSELDGGSLIVGDALINFEPYGFTFLPPKYCTNHRRMREGLIVAAERKFRRILFGHGLPILSDGLSRLRGLLQLA